MWVCILTQVVASLVIFYLEPPMRGADGMVGGLFGVHNIDMGMC